jgi:hypothetical protein
MSDENLDHGPVLDARDLDETRRLLYGALAAGRTRRWELVGTLVNALVHHSGLETDALGLLDHLVEVVEADMAVVASDQRAQRVLDLIAKLSASDTEPCPEQAGQ